MDTLIFALLVVLVIGLGVVISLWPHSRSSAKSAPRPLRRSGAPVEAQIRVSVEIRGAPLTPVPEPVPSASSAEAWVPPGQPTTTSSYRLPDGMIYVASDLSSATGDREEPAAIDPKLPVGPRDSAPAPAIPYWPSYSTITPQARSSYLRWLSTGRSDPDIDVGYVFLFFYGLERRLLVDALTDPLARAEVPALIGEIRRLLEIYGRRSHSFLGYAHSLLEACVLVHAQRRVYEELPAEDAGQINSFAVVSVALGQLAVDGNPLLPTWALAWVRATASLRTPADRCRREFDRMFTIRYEDRYGLGLQLRSSERLLTVPYYAASLSLPRPLFLPVGDVPDVVSDSAELATLRDMAVECCAELDPFSRWMGKAPGQAPTLEALALLPTELLSDQASDSLDAVRTLVATRLGSEASVTLAGSEIVSIWPCDTPGTLKRTESILVCQLLEKLGCGVEPDVRFGSPTIAANAPAVLFRQAPGAPSTPSAQYTAAAALVAIAGAVVVADDEITAEERERVEAYLEESLGLSEIERTRLRIYLEWLLLARPALGRIKSKMEKLSTDQRGQVSRFMAALVTADGQTQPAEIVALTKIYRMLGLDGGRVYGDVHAVQANSGPATEPVTVQPHAAGPEGYAIPARPTAASGIPLDMRRVDQRLRETVAVSALLHGVFSEDEEAPDPPSSPAAEHSVPGLDGHLAAVVRLLLTEQAISRHAFEELAVRHGLLPDGAIDRLNEWSIETFGEPLLEGEDPIEINSRAAGGITVA